MCGGCAAPMHAYAQPNNAAASRRATFTCSSVVFARCYPRSRGATPRTRCERDSSARLPRMGLPGCATIAPVMKDSEVILSVLRNIERRLWLRRVLQDIAYGACVILFSLIALQFVGVALSSAVPAVGTGARTAVVAAVLMLGAYIAWRALRQVTLAQAAGEADARARLKDELKSAYWFVSTPEPSPFAALQIARAAATARRLDPGAIVPGRPPRSLYAVAGLGAALLLVTWIAPRQSHSWDGAEAAAMAATRETQDLRALLEGAPQDPEIEKLDRALGELQRADATAEEKARA